MELEMKWGKQIDFNPPITYMPNNSNFSSTEGALKLRTNSPYSVMSRFSRSPPLQREQTVEDKTKMLQIPGAHGIIIIFILRKGK